MHKDFYASGFLYHPSSQQILLQQHTSSSSSWSLFGGIYLQEENPETIFRDIIFKFLDIKITVVHPVYSYFNELKDKNQYIAYATVKSRQDFISKKGRIFAWFSFKDVLKLQTTQQIKHDIVVGQRVIEAATRKREGLHTFQ